MTSDATLADHNIDDLGRMLLALTQEVWIMRDRMAITERLLSDLAGIDAAAIETYVGDAAYKAETLKLRDAFTARVLGAPLAARQRSVEQILARAGHTPKPAA